MTIDIILECYLPGSNTLMPNGIDDTWGPLISAVTILSGKADVSRVMWLPISEEALSSFLSGKFLSHSDDPLVTKQAPTASVWCHPKMWLQPV